MQRALFSSASLTLLSSNKCHRCEGSETQRHAQADMVIDQRHDQRDPGLWEPMGEKSCRIS